MSTWMHDTSLSLPEFVHAIFYHALSSRGGKEQRRMSQLLNKVRRGSAGTQSVNDILRSIESATEGGKHAGDVVDGGGHGTPESSDDRRGTNEGTRGGTKKGGGGGAAVGGEGAVVGHAIDHSDPVGSVVAFLEKLAPHFKAKFQRPLIVNPDGGSRPAISQATSEACTALHDILRRLFEYYANFERVTEVAQMVAWSRGVGVTCARPNLESSNREAMQIDEFLFFMADSKLSRNCGPAILRGIFDLVTCKRDGAGGVFVVGVSLKDDKGRRRV